MKPIETTILAILVIFSLIAAPIALGDDDDGWSDDWDNGWDDDWDNGWEDEWDDGWEDDDSDFDDDNDDWDDWEDDSDFDDDGDWDDWEDDDEDYWESAPEIIGLNVIVTPVTQTLVVNLANHERDADGEEGLVWTVNPCAGSNTIFRTQLNEKILTITPHKLGESCIRLKLTDPTGLYDEKITTVKIVRPNYDDEYDDEVEEDGIGIFVSSIRVNEDSIAPGEDVEAYVTIKNSGDLDLDDVKIVMIIQEIAARGSVGPFDLDDGEKVTKRVMMEIDDSEDLSEGVYYVRFAISNDETRRVVYREIDLEIE